MYYIDPYVRDVERIYNQNGRKGYLRLDLNENPGGLPQEFLNDVMKCVTPEFVSQYPETDKFTQILADHLNVGCDNICLVNGSAEGIRYLIHAFTSLHGRIVGVVPSYFMYQVYSEMYGREFVRVGYNDDLSMDISHIIAELTDETQMLVLMNPNNPMGNAYTDAEFEQLLAVAKEKQITVMIDEAYHYFYPKTFMKYALNEDHVFVVRTFSKLFSMAGCRLGYVVGRPEGIKLVQKLTTPHNTNAFAMEIAGKVITTPGVLDKLISDFQNGRKFLLEQLDSHGYDHKGDAGNFLFIKVQKADADVIVERMKEEYGILIKSYEGIGSFGKCLRVSIGAAEYMEKFVNALFEIDR